ncbi:alkaline phosphatase family protein [Hymenobacter sp. BT188]|uniref:alkaline phosphatase D family protein n=1 Tax=Hymenobacter sp. BT188 TaxID=2763504 RepID=UPI0016512E7E|nr:alkaline phosphatase D family protein [Hymenobacter sp. BT188]MBC6606748.1 alkaline phosphatase family protein [Hymenobacter sp. BT188]
MKNYLLILGLLLTLGSPAAVAQRKKAMTIAFGSCDRQDLPQTIWEAISKDKPDLWVWLGDNIYGDTEDMTVLKAKYDQQFNQPDYKAFRTQVPVIGTWDDHDYGRNDGDKSFGPKKESQQLALDFLQEPASSPRRQQEGIYTAYTYTVGRKKIKVILLDDRYHQDEIYRDANKVYQPNPTGDILGVAQWKWLEEQLITSDADAHIIGSGIQFLAQEHPYEKWANFPAARQRLFSLLASTKAKGVLLISGDRHIGEMAKITLPGVAYPIYEITSSGLTHSATNNTGEPNQYRIGPLVNQKHYGVFRFRREGKKLVTTVQLKGEQGNVFHTEEIVIQ